MAAEPTDLVKMRLTFWHKGKLPGEEIEVRREDVRSWHGFAVPVEEEKPPVKAPTINETKPASETPATKTKA
ncbi:hypothetical protein ACL07V_37340 [Streptomyces sp. MB22_4]|uniref:hypothetical protein n=1 Tax=Streptomyces sp. MB22_4 TaxID=3383120 RepID=UPI0039A0125F